MSIRKPFKSASSSSKIHPDSFRLFLAARHNQVGVLKEILDRHEDAIDWRQDDKTALMIAVEEKHFMAAQVLLTKGADPNEVQGKDRARPLHAAAKTNNFTILGMLLHHRATINATDANGNTPLMEAIYHDSWESAGTLLNWKASTTKVNKKGDTALHIAAQRGWPECTALLIGRGADMNEKNRDGLTPLMVAAQNGMLEACHFLLDGGCDHHRQNPDGKTALDLALDIGDNDPEFVAGFKKIWDARNRKDALTMGTPFIEGTDHAVNVRKPLKLRRHGRKPRLK